MTQSEIIGMVGAGAMGRGIAQVTAQGGMAVRLYDAAPGFATKARAMIGSQLDGLVAKGRLAAEAVAETMARISVAETLADMAGCTLVVEAVVEDLAVKRQVFQELEKAVGDDCILASNTSSLRIASIATACAKPGRVAGLHFFNPVPLMKLVEVIRAPHTEQWVVDRLVAAGKAMTRVPVVCGDNPGFIVNLGGRAYTAEALRIVTEGVATYAQVDAIMRDQCGFRMGPFELMDLTGVDVNFPATMVIYEGFFHDRRLATQPLHQALREAGRLGRKTRQGFYAYDEAGKQAGRDDGVDLVTAVPAAARVILPAADEKLAQLLVAAGAEVHAADDGSSPIAVTLSGEDCTGFAARTGVDAKRLVAIDLSGDTARRLTVMTAPGADLAVRDALAARLALAGAKITAVKDSPGFVAQRIRAMVANLGCEMAQIGIAAPADIDLAMTLGLNYPQGPLAMADMIGPRILFDTLAAIQAITGDDRYRPSLWLRRRALLGLSALAAD